MERSTETVRLTLKTYDRDHPDRAIFPPSTAAARRRRQGPDLPALPPGRLGRGPGRPVRPDPVEHLPRHQRDARPPAPGDQARVHAAPELRRPGRPRRDPRPDARAGRRQGPAADQGPQGAAPLPGQPLRGPAARPRAGSAPVPQDELPEVPGHRAPRQARPGPRQDRRPRRDRAAPGRGPGRQEPDHPRQPPAGRLDRQAARRPVEQLLRAGLRRQHVADPRRREVRLRPRQQVQHLRLAGRS